MLEIVVVFMRSCPVCCWKRRTELSLDPTEKCRVIIGYYIMYLQSYAWIVGLVCLHKIIVNSGWAKFC